MNERAELIRLGETFHRAREHQHLTIAQLAGRTGIDPQQITDLEAGRLDPTYDVLLELCDAIGVRASALLPDE